MKTQDLQKNKQYIYIVPYWDNKQIIRYTGTCRDVKDLMHWFFTTEDNSTIFLNRSEVETLSEL
jgi:hypothetical protein